MGWWDRVKRTFGGDAAPAPSPQTWAKIMPPVPPPIEIAPPQAKPPAQPPAQALQRSEALERLRAALDGLDAVRWCEGELAPAVLSIKVGAETAALDDVAWLTARAQPAPFGHAGETKLDESVRSTLRLSARGAATIGGLDLAVIVDRIEEAFMLENHLDAKLLDVLVYPPGGKFLRHKDTPREPRQLGTLLVEVPVPHRGGELVLAEGHDQHRVAWGTPGAGPRWVAFYGDIDHTVEQVESGTRVTLAYTLTASDRPRANATLAAHLDAIADAAILVLSDPAARPESRELIVPCERLAVASDERTEPLELAMLRGSDQAIARTFERCGIVVRVIELLISTDDEAIGFPAQRYGGYPLRRPIPASALVGRDAVSFEPDPDTEEYGEMDIACIDDYLDAFVEDRGWLVRRAARSTLLYEGHYSHSGYFGNEASDGYLYVAAALVLNLPA